MPDIAELIARLEKATGPDHELDELIGEVVLGMTRCTINGCGVVHDADNYTVNIDAALTLVPEGFYWDVSFGVTTDSGHGPFWAECYSFDKCVGFWGPEPATFGALTPALALCIAALKARTEG